MMTPLNDKVALVTGGSRGIGAAIARRLAADGAKVALTYANSEQKAEAVVAGIKASGGEAIAVKADNRSAEELQAAVQHVLAHYGAIDILVNNAGVISYNVLGDTDLQEFDRITDINVRAVFIVSKAAASHMRASSRIITIGSNLAQRVPWPGLCLYAMSKAALIGLTKGMARDLGPKEINVNIVHPGSTDTDMNPASGDQADLQRNNMAIQRYSDPGDVAGLVAWLAGPEGRSVTGAEFTIDNGTNA